jgi:hypothetical protein
MALEYTNMDEGCRDDNTTTKVFRNKEGELWYAHPFGSCGCDWQ